MKSSAPVLSTKDLARFWSKVRRADGDECWTWLASHNDRGRAIFTIWGAGHNAARIALYIESAEWHPDLFALHSCDNGHLGCVNPKHLYWGTRQQNGADAAIAGRCANQRVSADDVVAIRLAYRSGQHRNEIAARFKIRPHTVYLIATGRRWGHLLDGLPEAAEVA